MGKNEHLNFPFHLEVSGFAVEDEAAQPDISFYPTPPLTDGEINVERLDTFFLSTLEHVNNIVFLADDEVIALLCGLASATLGGSTRKAIFMCSTTDGTQLAELYGSLHPKDAILVVLSGVFNQPELLAAAMALPRWKKVFVGPMHGPLAEGARLLQFPFIPVEIQYARFWQRSELVYLPLLAMGENPALLDEGFHKGYHYAPPLALSVAFRLWRAGRRGTHHVNLLSVMDCLRWGMDSVLPLLEESGFDAESSLNFRVLTPAAFKDYSMEREMQGKKDTVYLLVGGSKEAERELHVAFPKTLEDNTYLDKRYFSLNGSSLSCLCYAVEKALIAYFKKKNCPLLHLLLQGERLVLLGETIAFFHTLSCYNAWLRETDIMNDPPRVEIDTLTWDEWLKRAEQHKHSAG